MKNTSVKICSGCPFCRYTRDAKTPNLWYKICRFMQRHCSCCKAANVLLKKNFQESRNFKG